MATVGAASPEQLAAAVAAAGEAARGWQRTPAIERGEMLHEVARGACASAKRSWRRR